MQLRTTNCMLPVTAASAAIEQNLGNVVTLISTLNVTAHCA